MRIGLYKNSRLQNSSLGIFQHLATWEYEPVQSSAECKPVAEEHPAERNCYDTTTATIPCMVKTGNLGLQTPVIKVASGRPLATASQYSPATIKTSSILLPLHALSLKLLVSYTPDATGLGRYLRHSGLVTLVLGFLLLFAPELVVFTGTGLAIVTSPPSLDTASPQTVKSG